MRDQEIHRTEWLSLNRRDNWFEFVRHTTGPENVAFAIMLKGTKDVLVRKEKNPIQSETFVTTVFSGGIEEGETPEQTMFRELEEESGYTSRQVTEVTYLNTVMPTKFMDLKTHLFMVMVEGAPEKAIQGDGTVGEKGGHWVQMPISQAAREVQDPCFHAIFLKTIFKNQDL